MALDTALYRAVMSVAGVLACEVCGRRAPSDAIDVRPVVPLNCGGRDDTGNLVALCERHRQAADEKWHQVPGSYKGPRSPDSLIRELKQDEAILQLLGAILSPGDRRE
jgi:5-methylcytosine-specific restriction endonuclease McrA